MYPADNQAQSEYFRLARLFGHLAGGKSTKIILGFVVQNRIISGTHCCCWYKP
jgi:hypothetical protein